MAENCWFFDELLGFYNWDRCTPVPMGDGAVGGGCCCMSGTLGGSDILGGAAGCGDCIWDGIIPGGELEDVDLSAVDESILLSWVARLFKAKWIGFSAVKLGVTA